MKKFTCFIFTILSLLIHLNAEATVISGGISVTEQVPIDFFGSWKVMAVRDTTTNENMFAPYSVEVWNLSKNGNVITLTNPVSKAQASITVKNATSNSFTFQRITGKNTNETVTETAKLILQGDNFIGSDTMVVRTYKNNMLIKEEHVEYLLKARKLSGADINRIFGLK